MLKKAKQKKIAEIVGNGFKPFRTLSYPFHTLSKPFRKYKRINYEK